MAAFFESHRFMLKVVLIAIGVLISLLYCGLGNIGYHYYRCYKEGQDGYTNSVNALTLLLDVIFLILNLVLLSHSTLWRIISRDMTRNAVVPCRDEPKNP